MKTMRLRERIRKAARGKNGFGFCCSALICLKREVAGATGELIARHREERAFERATRKSLKPDPSEYESQRRESEAADGPVFSITVPLFNTPETFLRDMIQSVREQSWQKWELLLADGSDAGHPDVRVPCEAAAREDPRIRYRKLEKNGGISENSNAALEMATGEYIALLDHDDLLIPSALWEVAQAIRETGADFLYSDEAVFESPNPGKILEIHRKAEFNQKKLLTENYLCHLTVFRRELVERAGGFRKEYDGSQDHELFLRLTDEAGKVVHIPKALYFWRSHGGSVAADIGAKDYAVDAGKRAVKDFLRERKGIEAEVRSSEECATIYEVKILHCVQDDTGDQEIDRWRN